MTEGARSQTRIRETADPDHDAGRAMAHGFCTLFGRRWDGAAADCMRHSTRAAKVNGVKAVPDTLRPSRARPARRLTMPHVALTSDESDWTLPTTGGGLWLDVPRLGRWSRRPDLAFEATVDRRFRSAGAGHRLRAP